MQKILKPARAENRYIPYEERTGNESIVYFTRDLSPEGLCRIYERVSGQIQGKVAVKLHTGEPHGPNIIPPAWIRVFLQREMDSEARVIDSNTYYEGDRYTTEAHRKTLEVNGWTDFTQVDIIDEEGTAMLPVKGGRWFEEMSVGSHLTGYDSMVALTHFKGHTLGGFGGANKNIGIGCADGRIGKGMIHRKDTDDWGVVEEELMEKISESTKATIDFFGKHVTYVNVMRNISVSCDCEGVAAEPVVTPDIGICASVDILAVDQAGVDMIHALKEADRRAMVERISSRHGYRQLSCMKELGMGNDRYILVDIDHGDARIDAGKAVEGVQPFRAK